MSPELALRATVPSIEARADALLEQCGVDAIVASSRPSIAHLSGVYLQHLVWPDPTEQAFVVWTRDGARRAVLPAWCGRPAEACRLPITAWAFPETPMPALVAVLKELGLERARLGVETSHLTMDVRDELQELLPGAQTTGIDAALVAMRVQKTAPEAEAIRRAGRAAERAMADAIAGGGVGMTEREFFCSLTDLVVRHGADDMSWLALRWITEPQAGVPTDRPIGAGDVISIELGCSVNGYLADVQRTLVAPPAPAALADAYARLAGVHERTMQRLVPGHRLDDVNRAFLDDMAGVGLEMWGQYQLGHGLGLDLHEGLYIEEGQTAVVQPGAVFAIEPVIETPALLAIEDDVFVGDDGPVVLSSDGDWSALPVLGERVAVPM